MKTKRANRLAGSCLIIAVLGVVCAVGGLWLWARWLRTSSLAYIPEATGLQLPAHLFDVDVYDSGDFYLVAHVRLAQEDVAAFAGHPGFSSTPIEMAGWTEGLHPENRLLAVTAGWLFIEGHAASTRWIGALEPPSGRFWIVVFYPDPGGTPP